MDPLLLALPLTAAAGLGWAATARYREHRPTAALLTAFLAVAGAERALDAAALAPLRASLGPGPWHGWPWAAALLSHAVGLAWPAAVVAAALAVFPRRSPWLALPGWAAAIALYAALHPLGEDQARFHACAEAAGSAVAACVAALWFRREPGERASSAQLTLAAVVMADLLTTPAVLRGGPLAGLPGATALWGLTFGLLAVMHAYAIWCRLAKCERRQDAADRAVLRSNLVADGAAAAAQRAEQQALEARDLADLAPSSRP